MSEICKNCENEIAVNFCSFCGQKKAKRIDRNYIKDEVQYTLIHTNKGFFYSIKCLLKNPGRTAREFVEGNRVNHYKPLAMVFILSGLAAFINNTVLHPEEIYTRYNEIQQAQSPIDMKEYMHFMMKYYAFIMLLNIPIMAIFTWLGYKKWGYNYYENIIICAYYLALLMVFTLLIIMPVQFLLKGNPFLFMILPSILSMVVSICLYLWFFVGLYNKKSPGDVIVRSILVMVVGMIIFIIICMGLGILWALFFLKHKV